MEQQYKQLLKYIELLKSEVVKNRNVRTISKIQEMIKRCDALFSLSPFNVNSMKSDLQVSSKKHPFMVFVQCFYIKYK